MDDFETQLVNEGGNTSFAGTNKDVLLIAFLERFALAADVLEKRDVVSSTLVQGTPEALYYSALCDLLEMQTALAIDRGELSLGASAEAMRLLQSKKDTLMATANVLDTKHYCLKKAARVKQRLLLLELELKSKVEALEANNGVGRTADTDAKKHSELEAALGLKFADPTPAAAVAELPNDLLPTQFDNSLLDTDKVITEVLECSLRRFHFTELQVESRKHLSQMDSYTREQLFHRVYFSKHRQGYELVAEQRQMILEVFLDSYAFDCFDVNGFFELIIEDMRWEELQLSPREFGFRAAHQKLSLPHLKQLLQNEPALFQNSAPFAIRGVQLLQAAAAEVEKDVLDCRDSVQRERELDYLTMYLDFLKEFSANVNYIRLVLLHHRLKLLQLQHWREPSKLELLRALFDYLQIPRLDALYMNPSVFAGVPAEHAIDFSSELSRKRSIDIFVLRYPNLTKARDRQLIEDILHTLWSSGHVSDDVEQSFAQYLAEDFLRTVKAQCMIKSGQGDVSEWSEHLPQLGRELADLSSKSELAFCESNPSYLSPADDLAVLIRVRNVKRLTIHLYELRTIDYYSRVRKEIRGDINLDGLLPNIEQTVDLSHLTPFQEARIPVSFPQVKLKRGVFVVEVLESNQTCRAILRKGFLRHVERITDAGHELLVFDEGGELLRDAKALVLNLKSGSSRAQPGRTYHADAEGKILIPFRHAGESASADKFAIAFCHGEFGFFHRTFKYLTDRVALQADMHIDSEQLVSGSKAQLIARPYLLLEDTHQELSLKRLTQMKLTVKFSKVGTSANGGEEVFKFSDMEEFLRVDHSFEIPMDTKSVTVTLSARVLKAGQDSSDSSLFDGKFASPVVSHSKSFQVQRVTKYPDTYTPHLIRRPVTSSSGDGNADELSLLVLGHNGESMSNVEMKVSCKCFHLTNDVTVSLQSDSNGEIKLGQLKGVQQIQAHSPHGPGSRTPWIWELPGLRFYQPRLVNCSVDEAIEIPLPPTFRNQVAAWLSKSQVGLYRVIDTGLLSPVLESAARPHSSMEVVKNKAGEAVLLKITIQTSGKYVLYARPLNLKFPITVVKSKNVDVPVRDGVLVQQKQLLLSTTSHPLTILSHEIKDDEETRRPVLEIQLRNYSLESTQIIVTFKRFVDVQGSKINQVLTTSGLKKFSTSDVRLPDWVFDVTLFENEYLKKRKISDEYKYILERRLQTQANPSSLQSLGASNLSKPSLLQNPHVIESTDMEDIVMGAGDKVQVFQEFPESGRAYSLEYEETRRKIMPRALGVPSISFLGQASQVVSTREVSADGLVRIDLKKLDFFKEDAYGSEGTFEMIVVAVDYTDSQVCSSESLMSLPISGPSPVTKIPKRDIRLSSDEALTESDHYLQKQQHEVVRAGEHRILARSSSTKYALYESIDDVMQLWNTLSSNTLTQGLTERLRQWPTMNLDAKLKFYYANASDDLNLFLSRKDTMFFSQFVKPLVESKISKSLIDHCLLEDEATIRRSYLAPGVFQELSVIEKLLIAEQMSSIADVAKICERVNLDIEYASNPNTLRHLFESVLSQGAIKPSEYVPPPPPAQSLGRGGSPGTSGLFGSTSGGPTNLVTQACSFDTAAAAPISRARQRSAMSLSKKASSQLAPFSPAYESDDDFGVRSVSSDEEDSSDDDENDDENKQVVSKRRDTAYIPPGKVRMVREKRFFDSQRPRLDGRNQFWKAYADHILRTKTSELNGSGNEEEKGFVSSFFPEALPSTLNEGLLALAVLDLPLRASGSTEIHAVSPAGNKVELSPRSDIVLYHQNIEVGECSDDPNSKLILKQKIVSYGNSGYGEPSTALEFVVNTKYTCIVSASNVGSSALSGVNLLLQVPRGAIPLHESSFYTKNHVFDVPPNHTSTTTVDFYFPEAGRFEQYPAQAAVDSKVAAWASTVPTTIQVLLHPTLVDLTSWSDVSARGTLADVLGYLSSHKKMLSVDLIPLCWRCKDEAFYRGVTSFLREKMVYQESIWKYAFVHNDAVGMRELLSSSTDLMQSVGLGLETSFFTTSELYQYERCIDSIDNEFDHSEFGPFLHRRVHDVNGSATTTTPSLINDQGSSNVGGSGAHILNKNARVFYHSLCQRLGLFATLDGQHLLVLTYFMLLFNRVEDALSLFTRLGALPASKKANVERSVQYDYVNAYLDVFRVSPDDDKADFSVARRNVAKHKKHPHARWRARFVQLGEFVAEYDHYETQKSSQAREQGLVTQADGSNAASDASMGVPLTKTLQVKLDATAANGKVELTSQYLGKCEVSFYPIDVEFMFSSEPFGTFSDSAGSASSLLLIQPREQVIVTLDTKTADSVGATGNGDSNATDDGEEAAIIKTAIEIPHELQRQQMMVRVREQPESRLIETVAAPIDLMRSYFNSSLQVEVMKQSGILQVFQSDLPVARCYVKVYAKVSSSGSASAGGRKRSGAANGKAQFYKDGYTDLLGKFDYVGINGDLISRVEKFSILVSHARFGASVREADPPVLATTSGDFEHQEEHEMMLY